MLCGKAQGLEVACLTLGAECLGVVAACGASASAGLFVVGCVGIGVVFNFGGCHLVEVGELIGAEEHFLAACHVLMALKSGGVYRGLHFT